MLVIAMQITAYIIYITFLCYISLNLTDHHFRFQTIQSRNMLVPVHFLSKQQLPDYIDGKQS